MSVYRHHAAALALAGWYLMTPPFAPSPIGYNARAPLSTWPIIETFDTAGECKDERANVIQIASRVARASHDPTAQRHLYFWLASHCLSTDDPLLNDSTEASPLAFSK
jgi:hypothetical protein